MNHRTNTLLVELLTEELPPKALFKLGDAFAKGIEQSLMQQGLLSSESIVKMYATPRRLAVSISGVLACALDREVKQKLVPVSVGITPEGQASPALQKKLAALGFANVSVSELLRESDGKADILFLQTTQAGATLAQGLQTALEQAISKLPIPKMMSYQRHSGAKKGTTVHFVRPAHRLVALYGEEIVPVEILGLTAGRITQGHRFLSVFDANVGVSIKQAQDYADLLREAGKVVACFVERKQMILNQLNALKNSAYSDEVIAPDSLVDEVNGLVEYPVVYECFFDEEFLAVPQECLILTMQTNQKYFATTKLGKLSTRFLVVSNMQVADPKNIIEGNQRVIAPRLSDAKFFFETDKKTKLLERLPRLETVVYHNQLGTQWQRVLRVEKLASAIAQSVFAKESNVTELIAQVALAARLSKADLTTDMVGEFPELQGIMGRYYAQHEGIDDVVAFAIEDHYKPRFAGDVLPQSLVGVCVALADKLETLAGLFSIGQTPTGDKDPFSLRRHALGVIRMIVEKKLPLSLSQLLMIAFDNFAEVKSGALSELRDFIFERLAGLLREQGFTAHEIDAVLSLRPDCISDVLPRIEAVREFAKLPEAQSLAAANKRVSNILKKVTQEIGEVDHAHFVLDAERHLYQALLTVNPNVDSAFSANNYTLALQLLAALRTPIDVFFEEVMVNVDDDLLRQNRLALLKSLHVQMNRVADISALAH